MPMEIIVPAVASRYTAGSRPFDLFMKLYVLFCGVPLSLAHITFSRSGDDQLVVLSYTVVY